MIKLTQWLCPERHCVIAYLWDTTTTTEKDMVEKGEDVFKSNAIRRQCAICNGDIHVETKVTKYSTIKEAMPEMVELQAANLRGMALLQKKVPDRIRVKMLKRVRPDLRWLHPDNTTANPGEEYDAEANQNGAVTIIFPSGYKLGVKPDEFEFIEAPEWLRRIHAAKWN